jgi:hypothetical protein
MLHVACTLCTEVHYLSSFPVYVRARPSILGSKSTLKTRERISAYTDSDRFEAKSSGKMGMPWQTNGG